MKTLVYWFKSKFNKHYTNVDGIWVFDDFDMSIMKPVVTVLTGPAAGVKITLFQLTLRDNGEPRFHVTLEKNSKVLTEFDPGFDKFVERVFKTIFP